MTYTLQKLNVVRQTTDEKVKDRLISEGFTLVGEEGKTGGKGKNSGAGGGS